MERVKRVKMHTEKVPKELEDLVVENSDNGSHMLFIRGTAIEIDSILKKQLDVNFENIMFTITDERVSLYYKKKTPQYIHESLLKKSNNTYIPEPIESVKLLVIQSKQNETMQLMAWFTKCLNLEMTPEYEEIENTCMIVGPRVGEVWGIENTCMIVGPRVGEVWGIEINKLLEKFNKIRLFQAKEGYMCIQGEIKLL
jgi:hypothetical protein